jgi:hypothetical protein
VDAVDHHPVRADPVRPFLAPVPEHDGGVEDVAAVRGIGQMGQGSREPDGDLPTAGDADGLVTEAFAGFPVGGQEHPRGPPSLPPGRLLQPGLAQVVAQMGELLAAAHHMHPARRPVRLRSSQPVLEGVQAASLGVPLRSRAVPAHLPRSLVRPGAQRTRQPGLDPGDLPTQPHDLGHLATPRQRPLIIGCFGDAARPVPTTGPVNSRFLTAHAAASCATPCPQRTPSPSPASTNPSSHPTNPNHRGHAFDTQTPVHFHRSSSTRSGQVRAASSPGPVCSGRPRSGT